MFPKHTEEEEEEEDYVKNILAIWNDLSLEANGAKT
jgi:hypothetical protein